MTIALATSSELPDLHEDDDALVAAFRAAGLAAVPRVWDDPEVDWAAHDLVLIRSTWDYDRRRDEFVAWAERVESATQLWNPADVVRWNSHKSYLLELEERGAPIVPTAWLGQGDTVDLDALLADRGWDEAVIKVCVGAGGRGMQRVRRGDPAGQGALDALVATDDVMVQPFQAAVASRGELTLLYVDGVFAHGVRKLPAAGEFRIHEEHGGSSEAFTPPSELIDLGTWLVEATGNELLYARVDLLPDGDAGWQVNELELIEPSLYLAQGPGTAVLVAEAVARRRG